MGICNGQLLSCHLNADWAHLCICRHQIHFWFTVYQAFPIRLGKTAPWSVTMAIPYVNIALFGQTMQNTFRFRGIILSCLDDYRIPPPILVSGFIHFFSLLRALVLIRTPLATLNRFTRNLILSRKLRRITRCVTSIFHLFCKWAAVDFMEDFRPPPAFIRGTIFLVHKGVTFSGFSLPGLTDHRLLPLSVSLCIYKWSLTVIVTTPFLCFLSALRVTAISRSASMDFQVLSDSC